MLQPRLRTGFRRRALIIAVATAMVAGVLALFGMQSVQRIQAVQDRWTAYSRDASEAGYLLHNISQQMGYGGFIHNFKNYILRRNLKYLSRLEHQSDEVFATLNALEGRVISEEEKVAVHAIRDVFEQYSAHIPVASEAFRRGLSSVEVDIIVKVDDAPATEAIAMLKHSFLTRIRLAERETDKALNAAEAMVWVLLAVVPVVVMLGVTLILFLRRIIDVNFNLAEVRDELAMLLRQAPDAILHVASDGRVVRANDRALSLFGYTRTELLTKRVENLIPRRFQAHHDAIREGAFGSMVSRPIGQDTELFALTKKGDEVPVDISLNFSLSGGKRIATAIVRDITDRKIAEQKLQQAHDELEMRVRERTRELEEEILERKQAENQLVQSAKMATIGEMASGITHELNQPMNIMRMGVENAQLQIHRGKADMALMTDVLEKLEGQIMRMSDIINHMRVYSRLDSEGQTSFDAIKAVEDGCKLFSAQLSGVNVELDVMLPDETEAWVLGHATRLEQVMLNLLSNARDAILMQSGTPPGRIRVDVLTQTQDDGAITIRVEDNGGGIAGDVLPHIFAPFVTTKESGVGTGLGLSISYGIVEGMGGTIEAVNIQDGARFSIVLPLCDAPVVDEPVETEASAAVQRLVEDQTPKADTPKVLVVDDEITAAHSLSDFLQEIGYLVYTAYNGKEAMQIYVSDAVDAVITDLRMPVMDGEALIGQLRELAPNLPIFAMTGHGSPGENGDTLAPGATEIWRKPLSLGEVAHRLEAVCGPGPARRLAHRT